MNNPWARSPTTSVELAREPLFTPEQRAELVKPVPEPAPLDPDAGVRELEQVWGDRADEHAETFAKFMDSLPEGERKVLEADPRANDPAHVQRVLELAKLPRPADMSEAGITRWMKTNRGAYNRNLFVQLRYRQLIEERLQKPKESA